MRTAQRISILLMACMALVSCKKEELGDTGAARFSGTVIQKRPYGATSGCWQLIVKDTVNSKKQRVCVSSTDWEAIFVGDPFFRLQKYKPGK